MKTVDALLALLITRDEFVAQNRATMDAIYSQIALADPDIAEFIAENVIALARQIFETTYSEEELAFLLKLYQDNPWILEKQKIAMPALLQATMEVGLKVGQRMVKNLEEMKAMEE